MAILVSCSSIETGAREEISSQPDPVAIDSSIRYGQLPNGFSYFIKSVPNPQPDLYLRLYNIAGSNQEDQDQYQVAHGLEHLAFKPTQNFPLTIKKDGTLVKFGMGMYDTGGTSGAKGTVYSFDAPAGELEALDLGLSWYKDIMNGLNFTEEHIRSIGGELRQETLLRNGDDLVNLFTELKLKTQLFPCVQDVPNVFKHYRNLTPELFQRFHQDWYRPELMAVSVVGNIENLDDIERRIGTTFSPIPSSENPRESTNCDSIYYTRPPKFVTVERPRDTMKVFQNNEVELRLFFRDPITNKNLDKIKGLNRLVVMQMMTTGLNKRFRGGQNHYLNYNLSSSYPYLKSGLPPALEVLIQSEKGREKVATEKAVEVLSQVQKYGFSEEEWMELKQEQLQFLDRVDTGSGEYWENEIDRYYSYREALPANKQAKMKTWLSKLDAAGFNSVVKNFLSKKPEDIGIIAPRGHKALNYSEKEVRSWIEKIYRQSVEHYELPEIPSRLMEVEDVEELEKIEFTDKRNGLSGTREFLLDNGVKVVFKSYIPSSGNQNRINLHGFALKGADCFSKENYYSAINAPEIVENSGVNGLNKFQIISFLEKTSLSPGGVSLYVGAGETGIQTKAELEDLETMLQLVYLYFTKPNKSKLAFEDWKLGEYKQYQNPSSALVTRDFKNAIQVFLGDRPEGSFFGVKSLQGTMGFEGVADTNFDKAYEIHKKLYGNAGDFTFILSGKFKVESIFPLVQKYLGNLPGSSNSVSCSAEEQNTEDLPPGPMFIEIPAPKYYRMKNMSYGLRFLEKIEEPGDWKEQILIEALAGITNEKVWDLRWKKGFSLYSVGVGVNLSHEIDSYIIGSDLAIVPEEFAEIRKEYKKVLSEIKAGRITEEEFKQGLHRMYRKYDSESANKSMTMEYNLYKHYRYNQPWVDPVEVENYVKSLTVEDIVEAAGRYYKDENLYEFVMRDKGSEVDF